MQDEPADAPAGAAPAAASPPAPEHAGDVVGRETARRVGTEPAVTTRVLREALATALGVPASSLTGLSPDHLRMAVQRLASLTDRVRRLEELASVDELTGVLRRGAGYRALEREVARARRVPDTRLVVAFVDVDGLKQVNDTDGHAAGDDLLRIVGRSLRERLRASDLVIRHGGDEFVCALSGTDVAAAERTMAEIAATVADLTGGRSFSVGLAALTAGDTADSLVVRADGMLYAAREIRGGEAHR